MLSSERTLGKATPARTLNDLRRWQEAQDITIFNAGNLNSDFEIIFSLAMLLFYYANIPPPPNCLFITKQNRTVAKIFFIKEGPLSTIPHCES